MVWMLKLHFDWYIIFVYRVFVFLGGLRFRRGTSFSFGVFVFLGLRSSGLRFRYYQWIIGSSQWPALFLFRSLLLLGEVIFSSKSLKKSSTKMFPFNFQLSGDISGLFGPKSFFVLCSGFSAAMGDNRSLCLLNHFSEVSITNSDFAEIFTWWSWIFKE